MVDKFSVMVIKLDSIILREGVLGIYWKDKFVGSWDFFVFFFSVK